jgi:membrane protein DedA with SNARE-associated domain
VLALLAAVENIVPPVPADVSAALGAFLSARGIIRLELVYAVTVLANVAGAAGVYVLARGPGRRWLTSPSGRRLLSPRAFAVMEREYLRLGVVGIFVVRLLPGIRAAVPPFAGLAGIGPVRTLLPVALAAALWYAGILAVGTILGHNWEAIAGALGGLNRTLAGAGAVAIAVVLVHRRRQRRARREALWRGVESAFAEAGRHGPEEGLHAVAPLVLELVCADETLPEPARDALLDRFRRRWRVPGVFTGRMFDELVAQRPRMLETYGPEARLELARRMWRLLAREGSLNPADERMLARVAALLDLPREALDRLAPEVEG